VHPLFKVKYEKSFINNFSFITCEVVVILLFSGIVVKKIAKD